MRALILTTLLALSCVVEPADTAPVGPVIAPAFTQLSPFPLPGGAIGTTTAGSVTIQHHNLTDANRALSGYRKLLEGYGWTFGRHLVTDELAKGEASREDASMVLLASRTDHGISVTLAYSED